MRKSYYALPILAAGAVAAGLMAGSAGAAPIQAPIPTEYPWCELDVWCYDDDLQVVLNPRSKRDDVQYGGGAAFGN
ncbi:MULTISPECIES: hypothetical protein [Mycolicibacterium]|uniref:Secreted protein n=2 Tax=Mycolicibacterium gilvum TaxID=1804 RepID=E6TGZ7_MYCSR|nr:MULTISPECIES: hypothetical protein [Mycolicibacterium]ABP44291.1 hypothetical protein Mflv_1811 [Mycolicibacterium gilvum PYR-GCK]ADT97877.1 hypothetical protein Mspyr1_11950 [Mycolicibacterium gilvum Spyr1]MBV5246373.1 hypothetical protein [Mycolicibacterium sp. PAM1]